MTEKCAGKCAAASRVVDISLYAVSAARIRRIIAYDRTGDSSVAITNILDSINIVIKIRRSASIIRLTLAAVESFRIIRKQRYGY